MFQIKYELPWGTYGCIDNFSLIFFYNLRISITVLVDELFLCSVFNILVRTYHYDRQNTGFLL